MPISTPTVWHIITMTTSSSFRTTYPRSANLQFQMAETVTGRQAETFANRLQRTAAHTHKQLWLQFKQSTARCLKIKPQTFVNASHTLQYFLAIVGKKYPQQAFSRQQNSVCRGKQAVVYPFIMNFFIHHWLIVLNCFLKSNGSLLTQLHSVFTIYLESCVALHEQPAAKTTLTQTAA